MRGSEGGAGWNRVLQSARFFKTHVVSDEAVFSGEVNEYLSKNGPIENLTFEFVADGFWGRLLRKSKLTFYFSYHLWHRRAFEVIKGILCEGVRNIANKIQLRFGLAARRGLKRSSACFAANKSVQADCQKYFGISPEVRLETGIDLVASQPRPKLDTARPFRIIWTGDCKSCKALHPLLYAIHQIPPDLTVEVRILGDGHERNRWQKLAKKLGITDRTKFMGRLPRHCGHRAIGMGGYFRIYEFTRHDWDHQGVRDVITERCGIKIPVTTPNEVVATLAKEIYRLALAPERYQSLSEGALEQAKNCTWDGHGEHMAGVYRRVLAKVKSSSASNCAPSMANSD